MVHLILDRGLALAQVRDGVVDELVDEGPVGCGKVLFAGKDADAGFVDWG